MGVALPLRLQTTNAATPNTSKRSHAQIAPKILRPLTNFQTDQISSKRHPDRHHGSDQHARPVVHKMCAPRTQPVNGNARVHHCRCGEPKSEPKPVHPEAEKTVPGFEIVTCPHVESAAARIPNGQGDTGNAERH